MPSGPNASGHSERVSRIPSSLRASEAPRPESLRPGLAKGLSHAPHGVAKGAAVAVSKGVAAGSALRVPDDPVPPPTRSSPAASVKPALPAVVPAYPPVATALDAAPEAAPVGQLIRKREEEPSESTPITYREYAYLVSPGTATSAVETLLWERFREITARIAERPRGKFVQLAIFDHVFDERPQRAPLATLSWKDWRGDPVVEYPGTPGNSGSIPMADAGSDGVSQVHERPMPPSPSRPTAASVPPSASTRSSPKAADAVAVAPVISVLPAPVPARDEFAVASSPLLAAAQATPVESASDSPAAEWVGTDELMPLAAPGAGNEAHLELVIDEEPLQDPLDEPLLVEDAVVKPGSKPAAAPPPPPSSRAAPPFPVPAPLVPIAQNQPRRHRADEDLISELFETMHSLRFMPDLISGADFVLKVLQAALPCELTIVHIFDINNRQFVVVRAHGPGSDKLLLHRTSDQDSLLDGVLRRRRAFRVDEATEDSRYRAGRWGLTPVRVASALCGAVQEHGRYLGAIELVNPPGGGAFYDSELNALDYICEQFADFVASRPIIVDPDIVLAAPRS
jgi:hypothetical protein